MGRAEAQDAAKLWQEEKRALRQLSESRQLSLSQLSAAPQLSDPQLSAPRQLSESQRENPASGPGAPEEVRFQRGNNLKRFNNFDLKAKAIIWP